MAASAGASILRASDSDAAHYSGEQLGSGGIVDETDAALADGNAGRISRLKNCR